MTNVIELAQQAGFDDKAGWGCDFGCNLSNLERFAKLVRNAALEEAAHVCESEYDNWDNERPLRICATTIRNLKEPTP